MKHILCTIVACICLIVSEECSAQTPDYNLDFENWDTTSLQDFSGHFSFQPSMHQVKEPYAGCPQKWVKNPTVRRAIRTTDAYSGKYAVALYEWYNGSANSLVLGDCYDQFFLAADMCAVKYPQKLYGISGYYKFYPDSMIPATPWLIIKTYYTDTLLLRARVFTVDSFAFKPKNFYEHFNLYLKSVPNNIPDSFSMRFDINTVGMGISVYAYNNFLYLDGLQFHYAPYTALKSEPLSVKKREVQLFPNPARGSFSLSVQEPVNVQVYDNLGKTVQTYTGVTNGQALSIQGLTTGIYIVKVIERMDVSYLKLQIE